MIKNVIVVIKRNFKLYNFPNSINIFTKVLYSAMTLLVAYLGATASLIPKQINRASYSMNI